jgi:shikimate dehydrogenase
MSPQRFGIIGQGIEYSLSPILHLFAAKTLNLDISYEIFQPSANDFSAFVARFFATGGAGLNVTTPFKIQARQVVHQCKLPAINTIYRDGDKLVGTSTDGTGFEAALGHVNRTIDDFSKILILGNGGAAYSLLAHFSRLETRPEIFVFRRTNQRDMELLSAFPFLADHLCDLTVRTLCDRVGKGASTRDDLVIQATKAPQMGDTMAGLLPAFSEFEGTFVDLTYDQPSAIFRFLTKRGNPCQDGLPMLIEQARHAQQLWWRQAAPYQLIERYLRTQRFPQKQMP